MSFDAPPPMPPPGLHGRDTYRLANRMRDAFLLERMTMEARGMGPSRGAVIGAALILLIDTIAREDTGGEKPSILAKLIDLSEKCLLEIAGIKIEDKLMVTKESGMVH